MIVSDFLSASKHYSNHARLTSHGSTMTATNEQSPKKKNDIDSLEGKITGRPSIPLYLSCDYLQFSAYQILVRQHVEFFEALHDDTETPTQGRPRPINLGQVGIRCCFCANTHPYQRAPGSSCFPSKRSGVYQGAQNIASIHWIDQCTEIPSGFLEQLKKLRNDKSGKRGGRKDMWADHAMALGVDEDRNGLRFAKRINSLGFPSRIPTAKRRYKKRKRSTSQELAPLNKDDFPGREEGSLSSTYFDEESHEYAAINDLDWDQLANFDNHSDLSEGNESK